MDFFESQDLARRNTKRLVLLFVLAVIAIIIAIFVLAVIAVALSTKAGGDEILGIATDWRLIGGVIASVLAVVGTGSATKMVALRSGGQAVASMLGGRRIVGNSNDMLERKVSNVVEEMALASGTPVPPVYILDNEQSINAFAAGFTVDDAVIGINRGTAEKLNREELQGVVAHEFSHILNGDMRMSLRMVAILNGILLISLIGGHCLSAMNRASYHTHRRSNDNEKGQGAQFVFLLIAAGLYAIGSIGLFFGRWIKATVSQQREYLADASAVQFTRMPESIGGALKMIGGASELSHMQSSGSEEISHMFFGASRRSLMFATHPPLIKRIRKIDEHFDGDFKRFVSQREERRKRREAARKKEKEQKKKAFDFLHGMDQFEQFESMKFPINPIMLIAGIGIPTDQDVEFSELMVNEIPAPILHAARETFSARCIVFASLLDPDEEILQKQIAIIEQQQIKGTLESTVKMVELLKQLPKTLRLAVFEIIQGTLSAMSPSQYPVFRETVNSLIMADEKVTLFEFFLSHHLLVHLDRCFLPQPKNRNLFNSPTQLKDEIVQILSVLVIAGNDSEAQRLETFEQAIQNVFPDLPNSKTWFEAEWDPERLSKALKKACNALPMVKKEILSAAVVAISHDKIYTVDEVELFRAISESLDCPVPPLVATHDVPPELPELSDIETVT